MEKIKDYGLQLQTIDYGRQTTEFLTPNSNPDNSKFAV